MADNANLARRIYEAWNERDFDTMRESTHPEGTVVIVGSGETFEGPEGAMHYGKMWAEGFPDGAITLDRVHVAGDDCVVVEFTGRGTHTGTMVTSMGSIPATGRSITIQLCDVLEFSDGKVRVQRTYFDTGSLMAQLGLMSPETATTTP